MSSHLIDATEMYLRTVWELDEEGIPPLRARLAERLGLSAPSVSETVARLEEDGLLRLTEDRTLELTAKGRERAISVMRKHRLAERLLVDVIGLEWERVHEEACRWEHVISDAVEKKLVDLLDDPTRCPHGNPIPGVGGGDGTTLLALSDAAKEGATVRLERMSEQLQNDVATMGFLARHGLRPGAVLTTATDGDDVEAEVDGLHVRVPGEVARLLYVVPTG